jgi:hypothetical protein
VTYTASLESEIVAGVVGVAVGAVLGSVGTYLASMRVEKFRQRFERGRDVDTEEDRMRASARQIATHIELARDELLRARRARRWPRLDGLAPFQPADARSALASVPAAWPAVAAAEGSIRQLEQERDLAVRTARATSQGLPAYTEAAEASIEEAIAAVDAALDALFGLSG